MWFQVLGKDFMCLLWKRWSQRWGQCAHLRWKKVIVGNALWVPSAFPGFHFRNATAEQNSRLSWAIDVTFCVSRQAAGCSQIKHCIQAWWWFGGNRRESREARGKERYEKRQCQPQAPHLADFQKMDVVCLKKAHPLLTSCLTFFPKLSVTGHFWRFWSYLGWVLSFQWHRGTSPGALLLSTNLLMNF